MVQPCYSSLSFLYPSSGEGAGPYLRKNVTGIPQGGMGIQFFMETLMESSEEGSEGVPGEDEQWDLVSSS